MLCSNFLKPKYEQMFSFIQATRIVAGNRLFFPGDGIDRQGF